MSYINIETENCHARVILGRHSLTVTPEQIHGKTSKGLLLETSFTNHKDFFEKILGKKTPHQQYQDIVKFAQSLGIPLVAAEPTWNMDYYRFVDQSSPVDKLFIILFHLMSVSASNQLLDYEGEVFATDQRVKRVKQCANLVRMTVPYMRINSGLKNYVMAQRVFAFADIQGATETQKPQLDLIVGINHVGVIDALTMDTEDRLVKILKDQNTARYIAPKQLALGHYCIYNPKRKKWEQKTFQDPKLLRKS